MKIARSIQQSLLPCVPPTIPGFDVAGWNPPADETGGDFYDWQILPNGSLVGVLADVTGHGLDPAMLAAVCCAYARANLSLQDALHGNEANECISVARSDPWSLCYAGGRNLHA